MPGLGLLALSRVRGRPRPWGSHFRRSLPQRAGPGRRLCPAGPSPPAGSGPGGQACQCWSREFLPGLNSWGRGGGWCQWAFIPQRVLCAWPPCLPGTPSLQPGISGTSQARVRVLLGVTAVASTRCPHAQSWVTFFLERTPFPGRSSLPARVLDKPGASGKVGS